MSEPKTTRKDEVERRNSLKDAVFNTGLIWIVTWGMLTIASLTYDLHVHGLAAGRGLPWHTWIPLGALAIPAALIAIVVSTWVAFIALRGYVRFVMETLGAWKEILGGRNDA